MIEFDKYEKGKKKTYSDLMKSKKLCQYMTIDGVNCLAYVIFTPKIIHIILRKIRKNEKIKKEIMKNFKFKVKKKKQFSGFSLKSHK